MTDRPSRDQLLMGTARLWSQRSTCDRAHVGAVFSRDGRILMTGYNGAPAKMPHCQHKHRFEYYRSNEERGTINTDPIDIAACVAVHAEINGIAWAARKGVRLEGCEVHTTRAMCRNCAGGLVNAGVVRCVWEEPHRDMTGIELLARAGIEVVHYGH